MISLIVLLALAPSQPAGVLADIVLINGGVWTGDAETPFVSAIALWRDQVLKVGSDEEIKKLVGGHTKTIDLKRKLVVPGFTDAHLHLLGGGRSLAQVDLKSARDEAEFGRRLQTFDRNTPKSRWLLGGNWDHDRTFGGALPTATLLDKFVKDRPVFLNRYDGHMAVANSAALARAGITAATQDPAGGVIERDANGTPTGVLKDAAMALVGKHIPEPDDAEIRESLIAAMKACAAAGITSVHDMDGSSPATLKKYFALLQQMEDAHQLTLRVDLHIPIAGSLELIRPRPSEPGASNGPSSGGGPSNGRFTSGGPDSLSRYFRARAVKGFMDGSLGSSTAKMFEPYANDLKNSGVWVTEPAAMKQYVRKASAAGHAVAVHAIGDAANGALLDLFQDLRATGAAGRFRVEHAQHLRPSDYPRFKALNVIASMQPYHAIDDARWAEGRIGARRCESSYAFRSLLDAGAVLAFGSDWPVAPLNVMQGLDAAVNRRPLDAKNADAWFPRQAIEVKEALAAYTRGGATAAGQDTERGMLRPGYAADLVVLDGPNIFNPKERDQIAKAIVVLTIMNGTVVFGSP